ncbi:MAG: hypothetical protein INR62_13705, partial [Rhodospirillales bacterium]|nr:hypothetical protein [Acetobacter sp.]
MPTKTDIVTTTPTSRANATTWRPTPQDQVNLDRIAQALRDNGRDAFPTRAGVLRLALRAVVAYLDRTGQLPAADGLACEAVTDTVGTTAVPEEVAPADLLATAASMASSAASPAAAPVMPSGPFSVWTDGACSANGMTTAAGGWAAVFADGRSLSGWLPGSTNIRAEITAAIKALDATPAGSTITLHSDLEMLSRVMRGEWRAKANLDLWDRLRA